MVLGRGMSATVLACYPFVKEMKFKDEPLTIRLRSTSLLTLDISIPSTKIRPETGVTGLAD